MGLLLIAKKIYGCNNLKVMFSLHLENAITCRQQNSGSNRDVLARIIELVKSDMKKVKPNPPKEKSHKPTKIKGRIKNSALSLC